MCIVCVHYNLGKMTKKEADRALAEMVEFSDSDDQYQHAMEAAEKILADEEE